MWRKRYLPFLLGAALAFTDLGLSRADAPLGVQLPPRSKMLDDGRYQLRLTYPRAVAFFKKSLKKVKSPFEATERIHKASVKYTHFRSLSAGSAWAHINVATYEGKVFVVILPPAKASHSGNSRRQ